MKALLLCSLCFFLLLGNFSCYKKIITNTKGQLESKTQRKIDNNIDESTTKAVDKTENSVEDAIDNDE